MRIFNLKRIAYFEELGKDPEMDEYLSESRFLHDWVKNPYKIGYGWLPYLKDYPNGQVETQIVIDDYAVKIEGKSVLDPNAELTGREKQRDYYYNKKHDCMLFINKKKALHSDKQKMDKILIFISKLYEEGKMIQWRSFSIGDILEDRVKY